MEEQNIENYLEDFKSLPPMPNVMVKALEVIRNPTTGLSELAKIMSVDQSISTKTLSLANSAFYGFRQQITSLNKAIVILGIMKAKNIIMSLALKTMMTGQGSRELWEHSIRCAIASEMLANEHRIINPDDAFVMGFLHDVGKVVLTAKNPVKYSKVKYIAQQNNKDIVEVEREFFGTTHCELGALVSKKWQLPVVLTNCIKYHHAPTLSSLPNVCGIIYAADKIVQSEFTPEMLDEKIMNKLSIKINDPMGLREEILTKSTVFLKEMSGHM